MRYECTYGDVCKYCGAYKGASWINWCYYCDHPTEAVTSGDAIKTEAYSQWVPNGGFFERLPNGTYKCIWRGAPLACDDCTIKFQCWTNK